MARLLGASRVGLAGNTPRYIRYLEDFPAFPLTNLWNDTSIAGFAADKMYVVQTSPRIIERCMMMATDPGDLVLDPTCGSGTTAVVAEQWGRRWITIDTSRVAVDCSRLLKPTVSFARVSTTGLTISRGGSRSTVRLAKNLTHQVLDSSRDELVTQLSRRRKTRNPHRSSSQPRRFVHGRFSYAGPVPGRAA
jgi:hypothetical protein